MYNEIKRTIELADGRTIEISTGKLAKQADGAVVVKMGDTMLLATVVSAKEARNDVDFMPLSCEYKEKYASNGRFPGGFLKREGRPSDYEILISRLVDRALRPLFPDDFHAETFVTVTLVSADKNIMPDALAGLAASACLAVSDIPFNGPISEVRVSRVNGEFIVNPTLEQNKLADIDIMVAATMENIMMVEGEMEEVSEGEMIEAIKIAHEAIKVQCAAQISLAEELGTTVKREYCHEENDEELREKVFKETYDKVYEVACKANPNKHERKDDFAAVKEEFLAQYTEEDEVDTSLVGKYYHDVEKKAIRDMVLNNRIRLDGRQTDEIRPIWSEVNYLPSAHGSSVFTRGETQSLTTVTLGSKLDEQMIDSVLHKGTSKFLLHYNFPPFSTGDARPYRGVGRREVGHGNLAFRALSKVIPTDELVNPYTVRIVSDILESNGSSSMATVCAGSLALMDAGMKISNPVSGIAMGLITDPETKKYAILSDILGDEDHLGDMDFKVTGTKNGITATQMDIKVDGLPYEVLEEALAQAKNGIIQEIQAVTGATVVIEEVDDKGVVGIFADNQESTEAALARVKAIVAVPEVDEVYTGKVKSIVAYGAFIEILPGKEGLLHISEIEWRRLKTVEEVLKEGDIIDVKLLAIDKNGKYKLSRKVLLPKPEKQESTEKSE
jgi:polyribonucleotide nucleotidyltransferase